MGYISGVTLVVIGLLILAFGDKKLSVKGGVVLKTFSTPSSNTKVVKWVAGVMFIWFGAALLLGDGKL